MSQLLVGSDIKLLPRVKLDANFLQVRGRLLDHSVMRDPSGVARGNLYFGGGVDSVRRDSEGRREVEFLGKQVVVITRTAEGLTASQAIYTLANAPAAVGGIEVMANTLYSTGAAVIPPHVVDGRTLSDGEFIIAAMDAGFGEILTAGATTHSFTYTITGHPTEERTQIAAVTPLAVI